MNSHPDWVTSDLHFRHNNIIRYCNRPWSNVDEMNEGLIERWNASVSNDQSVIIVGDVALVSSATSCEQVVGFLKRLNGRKTLVKGNHDTKLRIFQEAGFEKVVDHLVIDNVLIVHHPPDSCIKTRKLITQFDPELIVHGHHHHESGGNRLLNVCVDIHDWKPVAWSRIEERLIENASNPPLIGE